MYWTAPGAGGHSADAHGQIFSITDTTWPFLSAVDVTPRGRRAGAIVALGDSITDGAASTPDTNRRWPDLLAARLGDRGWAEGTSDGWTLEKEVKRQREDHWPTGTSVSRTGTLPALNAGSVRDRS